MNRAISSMRPKPGSSLQDVMSMCSCPNSERTGRTCSKLTLTSTRRVSLTGGTYRRHPCSDGSVGETRWNVSTWVGRPESGIDQVEYVRNQMSKP